MFELSEKVSRLQPGTLWSVVCGHELKGLYLRNKKDVGILCQNTKFLVISPPATEVFTGFEYVSIHMLTNNSTGYYVFMKDSEVDQNMDTYITQIT